MSKKLMLAAATLGVVIVTGGGPFDTSTDPPRRGLMPIAAQAAPIGVAHAYFEALAARADVHIVKGKRVAYSLRNQSQLDQLVEGPVQYTRAQQSAGASKYYDQKKVSHSFQYVYPNDKLYKDAVPGGNWTPKDGARLYLDSSNTATSPYYDPSVPLLQKQPWHAGTTIPRTQVINVPLAVSDGTILVCVDTWYSRGWRLNRTEFDRQFKPFRFRFEGGSTFWSAHQVGGWPRRENEHDRAPLVNASWGRLMNLFDNKTDYSWANRPLGHSDKDPVSPTGLDARPAQGWNMPYETWVRHWFEIRMFVPHSEFTEWNAATGQTLQRNDAEPDGSWHMISSWVATETSGPYRVLYKVPWFTNKRATIGDFNFNFHTSQDWPTLTGPLVMYARNMVALRNYKLPSTPENDALIFQRPMP